MIPVALATLYASKADTGFEFAYIKHGFLLSVKEAFL